MDRCQGLFCLRLVCLLWPLRWHDRSSWSQEGPTRPSGGKHQGLPGGFFECSMNAHMSAECPHRSGLGWNLEMTSRRAVRPSFIGGRWDELHMTLKAIPPLD